ncbi:hypothetical protein ADUPG1_009097 [Aduncisulcus paluster]|uniref:RRM domain-containing protein n=1 Tax=Aduncisulcus paluster TaxID=2918883 RepID=A0ABQ5KUD2_9EUKA|nr:hypothetical protein ADUPG1_009097 [Aduncisulcus paluster]
MEIALKFGNVLRLSKYPRCRYGYVDFSTPEEEAYALQQFNGYILNKNRLSAEISTSRKPKISTIDSPIESGIKGEREVRDSGFDIQLHPSLPRSNHYGPISEHPHPPSNPSHQVGKYASESKIPYRCETRECKSTISGYSSYSSFPQGFVPPHPLRTHSSLSTIYYHAGDSCFPEERSCPEYGSYYRSSISPPHDQFSEGKARRAASFPTMKTARTHMVSSHNWRDQPFISPHTSTMRHESCSFDQSSTFPKPEDILTSHPLVYSSVPSLSYSPEPHIFPRVTTKAEAEYEPKKNLLSLQEILAILPTLSNEHLQDLFLFVKSLIQRKGPMF